MKNKGYTQFYLSIKTIPTIHLFTTMGAWPNACMKANNNTRMWGVGEKILPHKLQKLVFSGLSLLFE